MSGAAGLTIDWRFDKRWGANRRVFVHHVDRDFIREFFTAIA